MQLTKQPKLAKNTPADRLENAIVTNCGFGIQLHVRGYTHRRGGGERPRLVHWSTKLIFWRHGGHHWPAASLAQSHRPSSPICYASRPLERARLANPPQPLSMINNSRAMLLDVGASGRDFSQMKLAVMSFIHHKTCNGSLHHGPPLLVSSSMCNIETCRCIRQAERNGCGVPTAPGAPDGQNPTILSERE
ncbi:hypothetical protein LZ30DRAFT_77399 [Colletotrichum cereale]|nr:hypothetical protein LZ30DRAFT_77399 [Colletotrichum cereale]